MAVLGNIVREKSEEEATPKNILPFSGAITSKAKQDWGLNDKWNELLEARFTRLNELTNSNDFAFYDAEISATRTFVPIELQKGFSKKRLDHRHHALDALIIACLDRKHSQYLNSLNNKNQKHELRKSIVTKNSDGNYTKYFQLPWAHFPKEVKTKLETTIVSFKQNTRVINKSNNKTWQWVEETNGLKKKKVKQENGVNWAIRKPLHEETIAGKVTLIRKSDKKVPLVKAIDKIDLIVDLYIQKYLKDVVNLIGTNLKDINKYIKSHPLLIDGKEVKEVQLYEITEEMASRDSLSSISNLKKLEKITDTGIKQILKAHLKRYSTNKKIDFESAFNEDGVIHLNNDIKSLNNGKDHQPIYKVRFSEESKRRTLGQEGNKEKKYVQTAKGTNLYFAIYWDLVKRKRVFETVPLAEVIAHQIAVAHLDKNERTPISKGNNREQFIFTLSPNNLVYVPTEAEQENPSLVDFQNLSNEQANRIYRFIDGTGTTANFTPHRMAKAVLDISKDQNTKYNYPIINEFGLNTGRSKNQKSIEGRMIKEVCWKLELNRLGQVTQVYTGAEELIDEKIV